MRTADDWAIILAECGVKPQTAARWSEVFASVITDNTFSAGDKDVAPFLGQVLHETGMLEHLQENLNYSAERLMAVWPRRFPTLESAQPYARNPQALAEKVYGGRMGNNEPGEGARYFGRGIPQITGKDNYRLVGMKLGIDLLTFPDLLCDPETALKAGVLWWEGHIPDSALDDDTRVTRLVNGGTVGLQDRVALTNRAEQALA